MSQSDLDRWDARWRERQGPPGEPEPFLVEEALGLPPGPVLDVAAGDGRNALWLARRGLVVTAVDIAPTAIARLEAAARNAGLSIAGRVADLDKPAALAGLGPFASLVVVRFKPSPAQWAALLDMLQPGGRVFLCSFRTAQHERRAFPQSKTGLSRWFLAIWLVTSSKGGISALSALPTSLRGIGRSPMELQRQMGFGSYGTAWAWLHKIRRALARPGRQPLRARVEADETLIGGARAGKPGRGAAGKTVVAGAVEAAPGKGRKRRRGRLRLAAVPDASAKSLEGFLATNVAKPAAVTTDGWRGYHGLPAQGYDHQPVNLTTGWGDAVLRLPAIHLVFGLAKRWLLGTHHGAVSRKHLQAYLDECVFRFNRRTAKCIGHRFARLVEQAVLTPATTYHAISHGSPA